MHYSGDVWRIHDTDIQLFDIQLLLPEPSLYLTVYSPTGHSLKLSTPRAYYRLDSSTQLARFLLSGSMGKLVTHFLTS